MNESASVDSEKRRESRHRQGTWTALREAAVRENLSRGHIGEREFQILRFSFDLKKMPIEECDVHQMITEEEATSWRLCERIRVRELAATQRLGRMRRLRMLEKQKAWNQEAGFDRIEITAEMDAQRFRTGLDLEHFLHEAIQSEVAPHSSRVHA